VKLCKISFLAMSMSLATAGAAHAQASMGSVPVAPADLDSRLEAPLSSSSGAQFNLRDAGGTSDELGSQVSLLAESFNPAPSAAVAAQPFPIAASTPTADPASQSTTTTTTTVTAVSDDPWHLTASGYLWLPGVHGTVGALGRTVGVHASASDLLSHFRFGVMGLIEPSYKRIIMPVDLMWIRLGDDKAIPFPSLKANTANIKGGELVLTPKIGYRIIDSEKLKVDALAGFRYWHFTESLSFTPSTLGLNFSKSQNWVDPLVGGRITLPLSPKAEVTVAGDVGGWGVGSQLDYQVVGLLGYRIKPHVTLQVGYRYLDVNYRSSGTIVDMATSGVMFGITMNLK
jgi:hypothetical protein